MSRSIVALSLPALFLATMFAIGVADRPGVADEPAAPAKETKTGKKPGRGGILPAFYDDLVDGEQRRQIYAIQKEHAPEIKKLMAAVNEAKAKRDAAIEAVLRPEQKEKLAKLQAEAKANKGKAALEKEKTKEAKPAEAAAAKEGKSS